MTIKTKLILNVITVILIVAAVAATSIIGMGSVSSRLHYLTERSTPFQMRTVEFQRAIQGATADLIKVGASRDRNEFKAVRAEAEKSLEEVRGGQTALQALSGDTSIAAYDQLNSIAQELFSVTEGRLKADEEALNADKAITEKMREASARLKELDSKIKGLQVNAASSYTRSMDDTRNVSARVRNVEALKLTLKDFQLGFLEATKAQGRKAVLIAQGKCNAAMNKALQNDLLKASPSIAADIRQLSIKVPEYLKAHSAVAGQAGTDTALRDGLASEVTERLNAVTLAVEQEGAMASDSFSSEARKQSSYFGNSTLATAILASNSELLSLGLSIEGLSSRLFTASSVRELDLMEGELKKNFSRSVVVRNDLAKSLAKLNARKETAILRNTEGALASINNLLFVKDGIISKIRGRLEMDAKAVAATGKLRDIVLKQAEKGKQSVTVAQGEQEKAITTVNRVVRFSTLLIAAISAGAILFGIVFGLWIYRSIAKPLNQLIEASGKVSRGDLACILATDRRDEIGKVETAMAEMVANLRNMVGKIRVATENLASSSEELSATASTMEVGSQEQTAQIEQSAAAMTQMSQTTEEVARNSSDTSEAAVKMKRVAEEGRNAMHGTMQELEHFAETVRESAQKVEVVGTQSEKINDIVALIKDIADQTNLLALNAAIEAARAGEQGRGFAVVADSVRQLAVRTTEATSEIGATIREMETSIGDSVSYMQEERESVSKVVQHVKNTLGNIDAIVTYVEQVTDMVQRTAVAAEEQSASTGEVSRTMERISGITHELQSSFSDIRNSSSDLSRLAVELNGMVGWFTV